MPFSFCPHAEALRVIFVASATASSGERPRPAKRATITASVSTASVSTRSATHITVAQPAPGLVGGDFDVALRRAGEGATACSPEDEVAPRKEDRGVSLVFFVSRW